MIQPSPLSQRDVARPERPTRPPSRATEPLRESDRATKQVASYAGARPDILRQVHHPGDVLDVGCNEGATARLIRQSYPEARIWGIDINPDALAQADDVLEAGYCVNLDDLEELDRRLTGLRFDTIIAADVLEHTVNPWAILDRLASRLNDGGELLISLPNFGHWETLVHLLRQKFPRRHRGLYDDTHLRFFMRGNLSELDAQDLRWSLADRNYRLIERRQTPADAVVRAAIGWLPWVREYFVFQYILCLKKESA